MYLNYNQLYYFYVVSSEGSIKKASDKLHLTQPAISIQIKNLEESLGIKLFSRDSRGLTLTLNGKKIFKKAERIFHLGDEIMAELSPGESSETDIKIGASNLISDYCLQSILDHLWKNSSITPELTRDNTASLLNALSEGNIDLLISGEIQEPHANLKAFNIGLEKIYGVANSKFQVTTDKSGIPDTSHRNYIKFIPLSKYSDQIDHFFHRFKMPPKVIGALDDAELIKHVLKTEDAFSILPESVIHKPSQHDLKTLFILPGIKISIWCYCRPNTLGNYRLRETLSWYASKFGNTATDSATNFKDVSRSNI